MRKLKYKYQICNHSLAGK